MIRKTGLNDDFPGDEDGDAKLEDARVERKIMTCIAVRCHEPKAVFAHKVPVEGEEGNYVAHVIATDVEFIGRVKVILNTGSEPSLSALATAVLLTIRTDGQKDDSPMCSVSV